MTVDATAQRWLPPGPWRLRRGFVLWRTLLAPVLAAVAIVIAFFAARGAWRAAGLMVDEARVASIATGDVDAEFEGTVDERGWKGAGLFKRFRGNAIANVDGRRAVVPVDFALAVSSRDDLPTLRVLYTDAPRAFTTTWHVDTRVERWFGFAIRLLVIAAAVFAPAWVAWHMWRRARIAAAVAYDGVEVAAVIADVAVGRPWLGQMRARWFVEWELEGARHRQRIDQDPRHGEPLAAGDAVVLLVSRRRPDRALVVCQDLWPLRLPAHERAEILKRIAEFDEQFGDDVDE